MYYASLGGTHAKVMCKHCGKEVKLTKAVLYTDREEQTHYFCSYEHARLWRLLECSPQMLREHIAGTAVSF